MLILQFFIFLFYQAGKKDADEVHLGLLLPARSLNTHEASGATVDFSQRRRHFRQDGGQAATTQSPARTTRPKLPKKEEKKTNQKQKQKQSKAKSGAGKSKKPTAKNKNKAKTSKGKSGGQKSAKAAKKQQKKTKNHLSVVLRLYCR